MISLKERRSIDRVPDHIAKDAVAGFVRQNAPDVRVRKVRLPDGKRACCAIFTFQDEVIEVEAVQGTDGITDPDDAVLRRAAWVIQRRLGVAPPLHSNDRQALEDAIVSASIDGNTAAAEALGRELAMANERAPAASWRTRFEPMGGSMFQRRKR